MLKHNIMKKRIIIGLIILVSFVLFGFNFNNIMGIPSKYFGEPKIVHATIYKPYKKNNITASGYKFKKVYDTMKIIAVSRDLKKEYPFGTKVLVVGAGSLDGLYTVRDLMAARWKKKIDILVPRKHMNVKYDKVKIIKIDEEFFTSI
jgi:3D (Asp-Asp-Asp) domain-containing protein